MGPLLIGVASDLMTQVYREEPLRYALALMPVAPIISSLLLWIARRRISAA